MPGWSGCEPGGGGGIPGGGGGIIPGGGGIPGGSPAPAPWAPGGGGIDGTGGASANSWCGRSAFRSPWSWSSGGGGRVGGEVDKVRYDLKAWPIMMSMSDALLKASYAHCHARISRCSSYLLCTVELRLINSAKNSSIVRRLLSFPHWIFFSLTKSPLPQTFLLATTDFATSEFYCTFVYQVKKKKKGWPTLDFHKFKPRNALRQWPHEPPPSCSPARAGSAPPAVSLPRTRASPPWSPS